MPALCTPRRSPLPAPPEEPIMLDLYFSELRRFRNTALYYALGHLFVLNLGAQVVEMVNARRELHVVMLLLYALSGLGLALYQLGTYRQPSRWIWLHHRPLARGRIYAAIALASATVILAAVTLPLLVFVGGTAAFSPKVVDLRHFAGTLFAGLAAFNAWLAGAFIILHRSRLAFVILVVPFLLLLHFAAAPAMLALGSISVMLLAGAVFTVFQPDRGAVQRPLAIVASALPLQVGFYLALLWAGSLAYQVGLMALDRHPLNMAEPPAGGYTEASRVNPPALLARGLEGVSDARVTAWTRALKKERPAFLDPGFVTPYTVRNAIANINYPTLDDSEGHHYTWSHDTGLYQAFDPRTHRRAGVWGADGPQGRVPFESLLAQHTTGPNRAALVSEHAVWITFSLGEAPQLAFHAVAPESVADAVDVEGHGLILTNERVLVMGDWSARSARAPGAVASVPLPDSVTNLDRVVAGAVPGGVVLSALFGSTNTRLGTPAAQVTWFVGDDGAVQMLSRRALASDFPDLFIHQRWWFSPALYYLVAMPELLVDTGNIHDAGDPHGLNQVLVPHPHTIRAFAVLLLLVSGVLGWQVLRRQPLTPVRRACWLGACLVLGLPALLSLLVLEPRPRARPATPVAATQAA
jgi:hypothetical protein